MAKYKLCEYDLKLLQKARHQVAAVANYIYGTPNSRSLYNRLETIVAKLDAIREEAENYND